VIQRVKVCLNGSRTGSEHPALPLTPAQLAVSAQAAVDAGAEAIHLHPRAPDGTQSLRAADIGAAVGAVRQTCPGVPVGVSTGLWITGHDVGRRLAEVRRWTSLSAIQRPDFASVNLSEPGFATLVAALAEAGIAAEAGVWSVADARALAGAGRELGWIRILVEIMDAAAEAAAEEAHDVLTTLYSLGRDAGIDAPVLLHGEQQACWPLVREAGRLGLATRIGLEDVTSGPDGEPVLDNAELVTLALREWRSAAIAKQ
jgi:uncharacterized protein (DUF849 family)